MALVSLTPGRAAADPPSHHVLIWDNAKLLTAPRLDAEYVRHYRWDSKERSTRLGDVLVMSFVSQTGGFFELENVVDAEALHCYPAALGNLTASRIRVFVLQEDVVKATNAPLNETFEDGTSIRLPPGVAIMPGPNGTTIGVDGLLLQIATAVRGANYFRPQKALAQPSAAHSVGLEAELVFDGQRKLTRRSGRTSPDAVDVAGADPEGEQRPVTLNGHCGKYGVKLSAAQELSLAGQPTAPTPAATKTEAKGMVASGARLFWPDGREAGQALEALEIASWRKVGGFACFAQTLSTDPGRVDAEPERTSLEICVTNSNLTPR